MRDRLPPILAVEDNEDDAFALKRAFRRSDLEIDLHLIEDGKAAMDYLSGTGPFADRELHPIPRVILLDLKLPYLSGLEVLAEIRRAPALQSLPVVILSGSDEARDHARANELGVQGYLVKPPTAENLVEVIQPWLNQSE